jgi:alkanesulfonate monooxygenase SsuD/methylene tetrahydromethanopterin reductase-like flavin-dependent oxidoreductase (luciferase family)
MGATVRLGALVVPEHKGAAGAAVWEQVEQLGITSGWTVDHLSWRSPQHGPWFDAMPTLAAAAHRTGRMTVGPLVVTPDVRHPVLAARQAVTLDYVSDGRFVLGVGAGGPDGSPSLSPADRAARFEEFVTLLDLLLRQPVTTFAGRWFSADAVAMVPGCIQQPRLPLAVAATGPRGMRLAAEHGALWVTAGDGRRPGPEAFDGLRRQVDQLAEACAGAGREPDTLRRLVHLSRLVPDPYGSPERLVDLLGRCAELGFTDAVLAYPRAGEVFAADRAAFAAAVQHALGFVGSTPAR